MSREGPGLLAESDKAFRPQKRTSRNFLYLWAIFSLLDPDTDSGTPLNPDPIRIWIRIHNTASHPPFPPVVLHKVIVDASQYST
jgi:hypothetical protein